MIADLLAALSPELPVLIAGPTASGKSALALRIAETQGGVIVNADALQVYGTWCILTARPDAQDMARAPHRLYGHVGRAQDYSAGHWLREVAPLLQGAQRAIIVGGTGLYFSALTEGLAEIPPTPPALRAEADRLTTERLRAELHPLTAQRIDLANRARVQRAWEVARATGRPLHSWQDDTPPPLLPLGRAQPIVVDAPKEWLTPRIAQRFELMLERGALEEVRVNRAGFDPGRPADKAIGVADLIAHLDGALSLEQARAGAVIATRQYAKRQRTWFRARMGDWRAIPGAALN